VPNYRRAFAPGGTLFLTLVTYRRVPIFSEPGHVDRLRVALMQVRQEAPFQIPAAVVLPDHAHFLWSLPPGDTDYSRRVGRMKVLFTRSLGRRAASCTEVGASRRKHREAGIWHRRLWEHTIADEEDFERHLDYIHYNPVKHGLATCPHLWPYSSFSRWVSTGHYHPEWGCSCGERRVKPPPDLKRGAGE
jgi:REP-associated tyrosine transposase